MKHTTEQNLFSVLWVGPTHFIDRMGWVPVWCHSKAKLCLLSQQPRKAVLSLVRNPKCPGDMGSSRAWWALWRVLESPLVCGFRMWSPKAGSLFGAG